MRASLPERFTATHADHGGCRRLSHPASLTHKPLPASTCHRTLAAVLWSPRVLCCGSRWHAGSMDDRVAARVTGAAFADMESLAEEIGPAFQPPTQVLTLCWNPEETMRTCKDNNAELMPQQLTASNS